MNTLQEMLSYRRPAWSKTEGQFIHKFITPLGIVQDGTGNCIKRIGTAPVLWSCHTDTVHGTGGRQKVRKANGIYHLAQRNTNQASRGNCLGADDGAGVWLMCELIKARVEGLYIFHAGEEHGGIGSQWLEKNTPKVLEGIQFAIALDRRGTRDVITHQFSARCCSDAFARSLARGLDMDYHLSDGGVFTDTANYTDAIGECTNLSVGYANEHSPQETLDVQHLAALRNALIHLDIDALVAERQPGEYDERNWYQQYPTVIQSFARPREYQPQPDLESLVREHPRAAAQLLEDYGVTESELAQYAYDIDGYPARRWA